MAKRKRPQRGVEPDVAEQRMVELLERTREVFAAVELAKQSYKAQGEIAAEWRKLLDPRRKLKPGQSKEVQLGDTIVSIWIPEGGYTIYREQIVKIKPAPATLTR